MSQIRQNTLKTVAAFALLTTVSSAVTANAATSTPGLKFSVAPTVTQSTSLSAIKVTDEKPVLDWRTPSQTLKFDIPDTDWTSALSVLISADPVGSVSKNTPIFVQFNTDKPVQINTKGRGFDARIHLDPARVRPRGNTLRVYYEASAGADCLTAQDGAWAINLDASKITVHSRAKSRNLRISDIEAYLANPLTAPKTIGIVSKGAGSTAMQSLVAQGVGLRMDTTPKFTTLANVGDIDIIVGRRDKIAQYVRGSDVMNATGPRLAVDKGRPMRIIMTGDTDAEVLSVVKEFSERQLPNTRRTETNPGEIFMQSPLGSENIVVSRRAKLSELGSTAFDPSWNPEDQVLKFNVEDPSASQGEILLRLANPKAVLDKNNALSLELNGQSIGQTRLDKTRKSVAFKVPAGVLRGQDNIIRLKADINTEGLFGCSAQAYTSNGIYLGAGSKLTLTQNGETPLTDLSRLTATGAPFSDISGQDTLLVLPKNNADYNVALGLLAKLAQTSGQSWANATFTRDAAAVAKLAADKNILFITPSYELPSALKTNAPRSFKSALKGEAFNGDNLLSVEIDRYAGNDGFEAYRNLASKTATRNRVRRGGAAALYASPYQANKMVGVITNVPGQSFTKSVASFTKDKHWNAFEGSVARWNEDSVLMAELSSPLPGFTRSKAPKPVLDIPALDVPSFEMVEFGLPRFDVPAIDWDGLKDKAMFWQEGTVKTASVSTIAPMASVPAMRSSAPRFLDTVLPETPISKTNKALSGQTQPSQALKLRGLSKISQSSKKQSSKFHFGVVQNKAESALNWTAAKWDDAGKAIKTLKIGDNVHSFQRKVKPLGKSWRAKLRGASVPGKSAAKWSVQKLSAAALLLMLMFGLVVFFLGFSEAQSRNGSHH